MSLPELRQAFNHITKLLTPSKAVHGLLLAIAQVGGEKAKLLITNPLAGGEQYVAGKLKVDEVYTKNGPVFNVKAYGAVGNGSTDDTVAIQTAITACAAVGGGTLVFPTGTYRTTAALTLGDKVTLLGDSGSKIYLDYNATAGYGLVGSGSIAGALLLTADAAAGAATINVVNTYSAGDIVAVESTHNSSKWPVEVMTVQSATGTSVTFTSKLRVPYLTSDAAKVSKYTTKSWSIEGLTIEQAPGRDIQEIIYSQYTQNVTVRNCKILKHRAPTNIASKIGIHIFDSISAIVTDNWIQSASDVSGGEGISIIDCSFMTVRGNQVDGYTFGIGINNSAGATITGNTVSGDGVGGRGIKIKGCQFTTASGNAISNFGFSGFKIEDSGRCSITGNTISNTGIGNSGDSAVNVSSVSATAADAVGRHTIVGNTVSDIKGIGISVSATDPGCIVANNVVSNIQFRAIDAIAVSNVRITGNTIVNWGTGYTGTETPYQGIIFRETNQVVNNTCYRTDGMAVPPPAFRHAFTSVAPGDGTMFVGNVCTTLGTGFPNLTDLNKIGQFHSNVIVGLGQKRLQGAASPLAGAFEVGDRVENSSPSPGAPSGWVCTGAGSPGTWKELAPISL